MITGIVTGELYSTINHPFYDGQKLLAVELTNEAGKRSGDTLVAIDSVGAGVGESVLVLDEGNGARQIVGSTTAPVRSIIIGIIDHVEIGH